MAVRALVLVLFLLASVAGAQSRFVSDELVITMRIGPSTSNSIVTNLRSGDRVQVVEADDGTGYSLVRTDDGTEGWVLTRFLAVQAIARDRLATSESALAEARGRIEELEQEVTTLSGELDTTGQRLKETETANAEMNSELVDIRDASANALTVRDQNESLRRGINEREEAFSRLTLENRTLRGSAGREWFVVGAGVLLAGIVIGLIVPSLRRKKRSEW